MNEPLLPGPGESPPAVHRKASIRADTDRIRIVVCLGSARWSHRGMGGCWELAALGVRARGGCWTNKGKKQRAGQPAENTRTCAVFSVLVRFCFDFFLGGVAGAVVVVSESPSFHIICGSSPPPRSGCLGWTLASPSCQPPPFPPPPLAALPFRYSNCSSSPFLIACPARTRISVAFFLRVVVFFLNCAVWGFSLFCPGPRFSFRCAALAWSPCGTGAASSLFCPLSSSQRRGRCHGARHKGAPDQMQLTNNI